MAITSGSYTLKTSGGDYSTWASFWNDLGNLTGDITLTVDASAFTEASAPAAVTENLNGHTLTVQPASYPTTTDGTTGARITFNFNGQALNMQMEGPGTIIIQGIVFLWGASAGTSSFALYSLTISTEFTYIIRRNIFKGGRTAIRWADNTPVYQIYNNIIYDQNVSSNGYGLYASVGLNGFASNNTMVDLGTNGVFGNGQTGTFENNLVHISGANNYDSVGSATGNNNSSYDATAADGNWSSGANNRTSKTTSPFVNYSTDDFRLEAGSDPVGNGKDLSGSFTTDFFGNTRSTWDIGAIARVGTIYEATTSLGASGAFVPSNTAILNASVDFASEADQTGDQVALILASLGIDSIAQLDTDYIVVYEDSVSFGAIASMTESNSLIAVNSLSLGASGAIEATTLGVFNASLTLSQVATIAFETLIKETVEIVGVTSTSLYAIGKDSKKLYQITIAAKSKYSIKVEPKKEV